MQKRKGSDEFLRIEPASVVIQNFKPKTNYEVRLRVQNVSPEMLSLRVVQPEVKAFRVDYAGSAMELAPGLSKSISVFFKASEPQQVNDCFQLRYEQGVISVPLHATPPVPKIVFPEKLDFGFLRLENAEEFKIEFRNEGHAPGEVQITKDLKITAGLTLSPLKFLLGPGKTQTVKLGVNSREPCAYKLVCEVRVDKKELRLLEIHLTVVDYLQYLTEPSGLRCRQFNFGVLYFGESKRTRVRLKNESPKEINWTTLIKAGSVDPSSKIMVKFQTPQDVGREEAERIINLKPSYGRLQPFGQQELELECCSKVVEDHLLKVLQYARIRPAGAPKIREESFEYTLILEIPQDRGQDNVLYYPIKAKCVLPTLKFSQTTLCFGQVEVGSRADIRLTVENENPSLPVELRVSRRPCFYVTPSKTVVPPSHYAEFTISFQPNKLGAFKDVVQFFALKSFKIDVAVEAYSQKWQVGKPKTRGLQSTAQDYCSVPRLVDSSEQKMLMTMHSSRALKRLGSTGRLQLATRQPDSRELYLLSRELATRDGPLTREGARIGVRTYALDERQVGTSHSRKFRFKTKQSYQNPSAQQSKKTDQTMGLEGTQKEISFEELNKADELREEIKAFDDKYYGECVPAVRGSRIKVPASSPRLHINDRGIREQLEGGDALTADPVEMVLRRMVVRKPCNQKESIQILERLTGAELQNIISKNEMGFGKVFVNSTMKKYFVVRNRSGKSVQARLVLEENEPDFRGTNLQRQIVRPGESGFFEVSLCRTTLGEFLSSLRFVLNEHHFFNVMVTAKVELMTLSCSKTNLKIVFTEETDAMEVFDSFVLRNSGNSLVRFKLQCNSPNFTFSPREDEICPKSSQHSGELKVTVRYRPQPLGSLLAGESGKDRKSATTVHNEEARAEVKIEDGLGFSVKVTGVYNEARLVTRETDCDLGRVLVGQQRVRQVALKNISKYSTNFEIDLSSLPQNCTVAPEHGKIQSDGIRELAVSFCCKTAGDFSYKIRVLVRGGPTIILPFSAKVVLPNIEIVEPQFNFKTLTTLGTGCLPLTIVNHSSIELTLVLDLEKVKHYGKMLVQSVDKANVLEFEEEEERPRLYRITFKGQETLSFRLTFGPRAIKSYSFELPLELQGYGKLLGLTRKIICHATEANFLIEPQNLDFGKKIVQSSEITIPLHQDILIRNKYPHEIHWRVDETMLREVKHFQVRPGSGVLAPYEERRLRATFMPAQVGFFTCRVPVQLQTSKELQFEDYLDINLRGEGSQPRIVFDRSEIIIPSVPLEVQAFGHFKIINEGYESLNLRYRLQLYEGHFSQSANRFQTAMIKVTFPEGEKMTLSRNRVSGLISFLSKKPISFTIKLEILDSLNRSYSIPVSGTADNCLLSNYPFLERARYSVGSNRVLLAEEQSSEALAEPQTINEASKKFIQSWLQYYLPNLKLNSFPQSLIECNGEQLYYLIHCLYSKKGDAEKIRPPADKDSLPAKVEAFRALIYFLKSCSAHLNHIRPWHLLSFHDYSQLCRTEGLTRLNNKQFAILSFNSWLSLTCQILRVFYLCRFVKAPKQVASLERINEVVPSTIYSAPEQVLLNWLQAVVRKKLGEADVKGFRDFGEEELLALVEHYVGSIQAYDQMSHEEEGENKFHLLAQLSLSMGMTLAEFERLGQKEKMLYALHLMNCLPYFAPRQTVLFSCFLGESSSRTIQVANPSSRPVSYWIKMIGSSDFVPGESELLQVDGRQTASLEITFNSRLSASVSALILFVPRRGNMLSANALVYELKSQISGRKSIRKPETIRSQLYEKKDFKLQVQNYFEGYDFAQFQVTLQLEQPESNQLLRGFYLKSDSIINSKRNTSMVLDLIYCPMQLNSQRCFIIFCDPNVGEFQVEVLGEPELPKPFLEQALAQQLVVQEEEVIELLLQPANPHLQKARASLQLMLLEKSRNYQKEPESEEPQEFEIEVFPKTYVQTVKTILLSRTEPTKLPVSMYFKQIFKDYELELLLRNKRNTDLRRVVLKLTVLPKPAFISVELRCPARKTTSQSFPISNNSDRDWKFRVKHDPCEAIRFRAGGSGFKDFLVKKGGSQAFELVFSPAWICDVSSRVVLQNLTTNIVKEFLVRGVGEEPFSERHIYLKCKLKEQITEQIEVVNPYPSEERFRVETDLLHCYGPAELTIGPGRSATYPYTVFPMIMGLYTGTLVFYDSQGRYIWFTLTIETEEGVLDGVINISSHIRKAVVSQLELANNSDQELEFQVLVSGPDLYGSDSFTIRPNSSAVYEIMFRPLEVYSGKGRVAFINELVGQKVFELNLISENPPTRLLPFRAQIGKSSRQEITLDNPLSSEVRVEVRIEKPDTFSVEPKSIVLKPLDSKPVFVTYTPTSVVKEESCELVFASKEIGSWRFALTGQGVFPSKEVVSLVLTKVGESSSTSVIFKNPFKEQISLIVNIESGDEFMVEGAPRTKPFSTKVGPHDTLEIPIRFTPLKIGVYECSVCFILSEAFQWRHRIEGHVESETIVLAEPFETRCREQSHKMLDIDLKGLGEEFIDENEFEVRIDNAESDMESLLLKSVNLQINKRLTSSSTLSVHVKFHPFKPFKTTADIIIQRRQGGIWKFKASFVADLPEFDDYIVFKYEGNKKISTTFELASHFPEPLRFEAYINYDSTSEFTVAPKAGVLKPNEHGGRNKFTVSFQDPNSRFNLNNTAHLFIETEVFLWHFKLIAFVPKYRPPQEPPRTVTKTEVQQRAIKPRNFLHENIVKIKSKK